MAARAMGNFALSRLRIVNPRDGWPNIARAARRGRRRPDSGAGPVVRHRRAGGRRSARCCLPPPPAPMTRPSRWSPRRRRRARSWPMSAGGGTVGILFGRERYGLQNEEVALANRIITFPVNPGFASLNLAQAVLLIGYEWFKLSTGGRPPVRDARTFRAGLAAPDAGVLRQSGPRTRQGRIPAPAREARDHAGQSAQHLHPDGPDQAGHAHAARRGDGDRRRAARARPRAACSTANRPHGCARCWPSTGRGRRCRGDSGTVRGLARLLRRNPTDAERILWQALTRDRRFAGQFKRQTPVGRHIPDFVSFVHRIAIELVNPDETEVIVKDRAARQAWLEARDYRVVEMGSPMSRAIWPRNSTGWRRACWKRGRVDGGVIARRAATQPIHRRSAPMNDGHASLRLSHDGEPLHRHELRARAVALRLLHLRRPEQDPAARPAVSATPGSRDTMAATMAPSISSAS